MTWARRSFLLGLASGAGLGLLGRTALCADRPVRLRPPGARQESDFLAACLRCGQCVEACPKDALLWADGGLVGADRGTPYIESRSTACNLCIDRDEMHCISACPSGALESVADRRQVRMGIAEIDHDTCLAYNGCTCRACWHACPYPGEALAWDEYLRPVIDEALCVGCGLCEHACLGGFYDHIQKSEPSSIVIRPRGAERRAG